jgi:hypothetical protein
MKYLVASIGVLLLAGAAFAISITDYEVPVSRATSAFGGFQYNYASDIMGEETADNGNVSVTFSQFYSSLPLGYRLGLNGIVNRNGLVEEGEDEFTHNASAFAQGNKYLSDASNFFGFGRLDVVSATDYDRPGATVTAGLGYGRFINATPLARALRAEEELRQMGVLTSGMRDEVLLDVAKILAPEVRAKYRQEYDEWERYYYADIEKEFQKSGKLKDDELGSMGTLVLRDVLDEYISDRYYGYEVSAGVGYDLVTPYEDTDRTAFATMDANFAYPIDLRSQFVEFFNVRSPLTDGKFGKEVHLVFTPSYSYEISDMVDILFSYVLTGDKLDDPDDDEMKLNHEFQVTLAYYIANRITFTNTLSLSKPDEADEMAKSFTSGLTYRIR